MKCPQCKAEMKESEFDVGYDVNIDSLHCEKCNFNVTEDRIMKKAMKELWDNKEDEAWEGA